MAPGVAFVTSRERPLRRLVETADQVLSAWYGQRHAGAREGTHPARERILFTSRERIRAGDWTVDRTPGRPPVLREDPGVCTPRTLVYDIPSLLSDPSSRPTAEREPELLPWASSAAARAGADGDVVRGAPGMR